MQTLADILASYNLSQVFRKDRCDFCAMEHDFAPSLVPAPPLTLVYADPETGCLYCLACLEGATDLANALEEGEPTEEQKAINREVLATLGVAA